MLLWKNEHDLLCAIIPEDVMPLLNKIFVKAFGNVIANRKAVLHHGRYPPNRMLMEHPSLQTTGLSMESTPPLCAFNVEDGMAGSVLDHLLRERSHSQGAMQAAEKRKLMSESIVENIKKSQRLT